MRMMHERRLGRWVLQTVCGPELFSLMSIHFFRTKSILTGKQGGPSHSLPFQEVSNPHFLHLQTRVEIKLLEGNSWKWIFQLIPKL